MPSYVKHLSERVAFKQSETVIYTISLAVSCGSPSLENLANTEVLTAFSASVIHTIHQMEIAQ
jgi:hypothetical protein